MTLVCMATTVLAQDSSLETCMNLAIKKEEKKLNKAERVEFKKCSIKELNDKCGELMENAVFKKKETTEFEDYFSYAYCNPIDKRYDPQDLKDMRRAAEKQMKAESKK